MKSLFRFDFRHFRGDLFGGLTAGIVALPLALAFGVSSRLGPSAGLYGAIFVSFFAAFFGGTPTQISGPTAPMTAVSMVFIAEMLANFDGDVARALPTILAVFLLAGLIQIILGFIGLRKYIRYIPYPVVSGFMTAIGVIILVTQIAPSVGYYAKEDSSYVQQFKPQAEEVILENLLKEEVDEGILVLEDFTTTIDRAEKITEEHIMTEAKTLAGKEASGVVGTFKVFPRIFNNILYTELILALLTIFIIYGFKRVTKKIPSTLVALFVVSVGAYVLGVDYRPIAAIPSGLPIPQWGLFASFGALFGGIPGAGATIRTVVNINSGGKTRLSGMIAGLLLLFILLAIGPIASQIPAAVLAGILITVGIGVMDYKGLRAIPFMPCTEVIILIVVLVLSSIWNLVYAVGIGLVIASLMFMKKIGNLTAASFNVKSLQKEASWKDEKSFPKRLKEEVFIKHLEGPLFFGSTAKFTETAKQIPTTASTLVIRLDKVPYIDQSGLYALEAVIIDLVQKDNAVLLVGVDQQPRYMMERIDIIPDLIPEEQIFDTFEKCIRWMKLNVKDEH